MDKFKKLKKFLGKELQENIPLRDYTTMRVGGVADYFFVAKTIDDLVKAITLARQIKIPYFILGGGSNVLVSDYGFAGLVILNRTANIAVLADKAQVICDSGVSLARLIMETASHGLSGLEALIGIPGSVGGAVYGNAGAYGVGIGSFIKSLTLLTPDNKIVRYQTVWLKPSYRSSRLKKDKAQGKEIPFVLSIKLQLANNKKEEIMRKIQYYQQIRQTKIPYDKPSCGCIFKNPGRNPHNKLFYKTTGQERSAGFLLDQVGAKKIRFGDARVSSKHANIIINHKNARAEDIRKLIEELRSRIQEKYHILLEEEIEYVGQWN